MISRVQPTLQIRHRPGIVELGPGQPDPALLPVEAVREAVDATLCAHPARVLKEGARRLGQALTDLEPEAP